jgi:hypothetical protein
MHADILQLVTRRVDLIEEAAAAADRVTEVQSLDNEHLPMGSRIAVLMTGELRTFKHAVYNAPCVAARLLDAVERSQAAVSG